MQPCSKFAAQVSPRLFDTPHPRIPKIHPGLFHPMHQRHEDFLLHPQEFPHRFLHLSVLPPLPHLPQTLIGPLARVALLLRQSRFFDDLSDPLKIGANLRLRARLLQMIPRSLRGSDARQRARSTRQSYQRLHPRRFSCRVVLPNCALGGLSAASIKGLLLAGGEPF